MKIRISHFTTKEIAINKTTRPTPKAVTSVSNLNTENKKQQACRRRLAKKVGFKLGSTKRREGSVKYRTNPKTKHQRKPTKLQVVRNQLSNESAYAAHPVKPRSELLEYVIQLEVNQFRHGSRHHDKNV